MPRVHPVIQALQKISIRRIFSKTTTKCHKACQYVVGKLQKQLAKYYASKTFSVDPVFSSCMVLPRNRSITLTGSGKEGIPVILHFGDLHLSAMPRRGRWEITLPPMQACITGRTIWLRQGFRTIRLRNILIGEVWLATGQSNMQWRIDQLPREEQAFCHKHRHLPIRFLQWDMNPEKTSPHIPRRWRAGKHRRPLRRMSAIGFMTACHIQKRLNIPVGIMHVSWDGASMVSWLPAHIIRQKRDYASLRGTCWTNSPHVRLWNRQNAPALLQNTSADFFHPLHPTVIFEKGILPLSRFGGHGVLWYQGEADAWTPHTNFAKSMLRDIIASIRGAFGNEHLPFLMVQLPCIRSHDPDRQAWGYFRWMQDATARQTRGVECITTLDLGSEIMEDIHPPSKYHVSERLANRALASVYGYKQSTHGPRFRSATRTGNTIRISLSCADGLHTVDGRAPRGFDIVLASNIVQKVPASLKNNEIVLDISELASQHIRQIRYASSSFLEPNVVNEAGLPCDPFCEVLQT